MMKPYFYLTLFFITMLPHAYAGTLTGKVTDGKGNPLPYASILIKGTTRGTTTNNQGVYVLDLEPGQYTILCQYVGYTRQERKIKISHESVTADFSLSLQQTTMNEVIVKSGGEDPAYAIIRNAIKKRPEYRAPLDSFTCEAYIKTTFKLRSVPDKVLGQKITEKDKQDMGADSAGKAMIYLSESLTKIAYKKPEKLKLEIVSGRESGSNGYGFNFPTFVNFYENNVNVMTTQLAPRGFVSPVADGALNYYRYKYVGSFWEDGKEICQIKVMPKRSYEPLFTGTINITDGDWRIHSLDLVLTRQSQLQLLDTLRIKQIQVPVSVGVWQTKDQAMYFTFKPFGIDFVGNFVNVYSKYDTQPEWDKKYFNKVLAVYDTAVNKRSRAYWDSIRPVQLEPDEWNDYRKKDSIYDAHQRPEWQQKLRDSARRADRRVTIYKVLYAGYTLRSSEDSAHPFSVTIHGLASDIQYNPAEGITPTLSASFTKAWPQRQRYITFTPNIRYGISNEHWSPWGSLLLSSGQKSVNATGEAAGKNNWIISGGKRVSQFNKESNVSQLLNAIYAYYLHENYIKVYENYFGQLRYIRRIDNALYISAEVLYEDRLPLDNTTNYSFYKKERTFTPNYPNELSSQQFTRHQAVITDVRIQYQPGQRYIQFPDQKLSIGSSSPVMSLSYQKGITDVLGSDVNFDKWNFSLWNNTNFGLLGLLKYKFGIGGFLNTKAVPVQDYQHFNGNQFVFASEYVNSFQLAPYYANSTTANFYTIGHVEYHFNGLVTNKIPLFRRLNWNLVAGSNAFYVNTNNNYIEAFAGLENVFKFLRVDVVAAYLNGQKGDIAIRIGLGGIFGSSVKAAIKNR